MSRSTRAMPFAAALFAYRGRGWWRRRWWWWLAIRTNVARLGGGGVVCWSIPILTISGGARWTCGFRIASKAQPTVVQSTAAATAAANESCPQDERQGGPRIDSPSASSEPITSAWRRIVIGCRRPRRRRGWQGAAGRLPVRDSIDGADCHESQQALLARTRADASVRRPWPSAGASGRAAPPPWSVRARMVA